MKIEGLKKPVYDYDIVICIIRIKYAINTVKYVLYVVDIKIHVFYQR